MSDAPNSGHAPTAGPGLFGFLSRRRFLAAGLSATAAVLGVGGGGYLWIRGPLPHVEGLRVLSRAQFRTMTHIVATTYPTGSPIEVDVTDFDLPRRFDEFLADEPPENIRDLKRALTLVEIAPLLFDGLGTTFSRLDQRDRNEYWAGWGASPKLGRRQVSLAFRKFLNMVFYDRPEVWPYVGYLGPSYARLVEGPVERGDEVTR